MMNSPLRTVLVRCVALALCLLILNNPMQAYAVLSDEQLRVFKNGINYFEVDVACETSITTNTLDTDADMDQRLQYIYTWLRGRGLTDIQAAATVGNISVESEGIPTRIQGVGTKTSNNPEDAGEVGWGLLQWSPGRKVLTTAKDAGIDLEANPIYAMDTQLMIVLWQMKNVSPTGAKNMLEGFTQTNVKDAVYYFEDKVEGAGKPAYGKRVARAQVALEKYESQVSTAYADDSEDSEDSASTLSTAASDAATTLSESGCSPTGASTISGDFATLAAAYAWPYEWKNGKSQDGKVSSPTQKTEEYDAATEKAKKERKWVGNNGIDCGGFVTRLVQNSFDATYNTGNGGLGGNTEDQLAWLKHSDNWKELEEGMDVTSYKPGDVGIYREGSLGHTVIVVGAITKFWWKGGGQLYPPEKVTITGDMSGTVKEGSRTIKVTRVTLASASNGKRAPMADSQETIGNTRYTWFRYTGSTTSEAI